MGEIRSIFPPLCFLPSVLEILVDAAIRAFPYLPPQWFRQSRFTVPGGQGRFAW